MRSPKSEGLTPQLVSLQEEQETPEVPGAEENAMCVGTEEAGILKRSRSSVLRDAFCIITILCVLLYKHHIKTLNELLKEIILLQLRKYVRNLAGNLLI